MGRTFYQATKERHQMEFIIFANKNMFFALTKAIWRRHEKLGLEPNETNKIVSIMPYYLLRDKVDELKNLSKKQKEELKQLRKNKSNLLLICLLMS